MPMLLRFVVVTATVCAAVGQTPNPVPPAALTPVERELAGKLLSAKRIYVEPFGEDRISKTLQAMIVDAIAVTKRLIVTENKDKADLVLKGSALEKTSAEFHSLDSATTVGTAAGGGSSSISGHANSAGAVVSGHSQGGFIARQMGIADGQASLETVNDARAAVRLVSKDGDVVWSTTQESKGAKFKGAQADVAEKVVKQLVRDLARLEQQTQRLN
jgi:hypothetical protein